MSRSQHFAALVAQQPDNEKFRFSLAQALLAEGRPAEAVGHLVLCAEKRPEWMMPRILLGKALLGLGRRAEAKPWLEAALQLALAQDHEDPAREMQALLAELDLARCGSELARDAFQGSALPQMTPTPTAAPGSGRPR